MTRLKGPNVRRCLAGAALAGTLAFSTASADDLRMVIIDDASPAVVKKLARSGLDIAAVHQRESEQAELGVSYRIEAVASDVDMKKMDSLGVNYRQVARQVAAFARQSAGAEEDESDFGFSVYRSFDEAGGIRERIEAVARNYPRIAELENFGSSWQERPLYAVRLGKARSKNNRGGDGPTLKPRGKPEALFVATHHAREWVAAQMGIRLLEY
ncbi:MAG: M14 family zinc carboxypeptidase, partial [Gammaproteobacteria bacterium]